MKKILSLIMVMMLSASVAMTGFGYYLPSTEKALEGTDSVSGATMTAKAPKEDKEDKGEKPEKEEKTVREEKTVKEEENSNNEIESVTEEVDDDVDENDDDSAIEDELSAKERKAKIKEEYMNSKKEKDLSKKLEELGEGDEVDENDTPEIKELKKQVMEIRLEAVKLRNEIRKTIKDGYSEEEMQALEDKKAELLEQYNDIKILDVDSILSNFAIFKFDTPPVIKSGRTLIPVSAIANGLGAEVNWEPVEKKVTITKGDSVIELWIDKNIAVVDGVEVELDANPEIMNSRTIVPLRFIIESFNLSVEWNEEDETIELIDEDAIEDDTTTETTETTNDTNTDNNATE